MPQELGVRPRVADEPLFRLHEHSKFPTAAAGGIDLADPTAEGADGQFRPAGELHRWPALKLQPHMRHVSGAFGIGEHQGRVDATEQQFDHPIVRVGHDGAQIFAFFDVLATLANVGRNAKDDPIARCQDDPRLEPLDAVVDFLNLALDGEEILLALPQITAGDGD